MKKIIITLAVAFAAVINANAQSDTLVINKPDEVRVVTSGDTLSINISGKKDNPGFLYNKTVTVNPETESVTTTSRNSASRLGWDFSLIESSKSTTVLELSLRAQLYVGWDILLGKPSDMKLKTLKSYEAGIDIFNLTFRPRTHKWWVSLDWGMIMNRYNFKDCMMTTTADGRVEMTTFPEGCSPQTSYFQTLSSSLTLMGHYQFAKHQSIGLGVTWDSKITNNCSYKAKYNLADGTVVTDMNEIPIRSNLFAIKAEYMFADNVGLYLRYTPMTILKKDKAPNFQQLNVGLQLRF